MSAISAKTLLRCILLPLAMVFVVVVIIVATVKGIESPVMNQWEAVICGDYCQVKENWVAERGRKSSENNERKVGKFICFLVSLMKIEVWVRK